MRTIIAGSRTGVTLEDVYAAVSSCAWTPSVVLSGTAPGADVLGEAWARAQGVKLELYPANWRKYGNGAGHIRNSVMADNAEALIAIWDGKSPGTKGMIKTAKRKGLRIHVHYLGKEDDDA